MLLSLVFIAEFIEIEFVPDVIAVKHWESKAHENKGGDIGAEQIVRFSMCWNSDFTYPKHLTV